MKKWWVMAFLSGALASIAGTAYADETATDAAKAKRGVVVLDPFVITGHFQRPLASFEVTRLTPALAIAELRVALLGGIDSAVYGDPF